MCENISLKKSKGYFKMGLLSDIFSGKKRQAALDRVKEKAAVLTVAGMSFLSPANAFAGDPVGGDAVSDRTEIVADSVKARTDSVVAKFDGSRLKDAAERMMKTKTGAAVLTGLTKKDIPVEVTSDISPDLGGAYYPNLKKILINPECSDDLIASILVHEGTHALQAANGCKVGPYLNMRSYFTMNKAMEADAMKNQLFAAAELKALGDASVYDAFAREHGNLVKAYEGFCKQFGEQTDSVAKHTMLAYYNDRRYVKTYEDRYVDALNTFFSAAKKKNAASGIMQFDFSDAEIINRVCRLNGEPYMTAADTVFLQDSARNYVSQGTYNRLDKLSKKHAATLDKSAAFSKPDASHQKFYVVDSRGKVLQHPAKPAPKSKQPAPKQFAARRVGRDDGR